MKSFIAWADAKLQLGYSRRIGGCGGMWPVPLAEEGDLLRSTPTLPTWSHTHTYNTNTISATKPKYHKGKLQNKAYLTYLKDRSIQRKIFFCFVLSLLSLLSFLSLKSKTQRNTTILSLFFCRFPLAFTFSGEGIRCEWQETIAKRAKTALRFSASFNIS